MTAAWGEITVGELLPATGGDLLEGSAETPLTGISTDSRRIRPGELFWALEGERYDGHDFVREALAKGAAGVAVRHGFWKEGSKKGGVGPGAVVAVQDTLRSLGDLAQWWRHQHEVQVAVVTGSSGKTTTKEMASRILEQGGRTLKNPGNLNNLIGLPLTLLQLEAGHTRGVLEMGMNRPGEIARLTEIADPDVGLITNVGSAHLEGVGSLNGVARAKTELLERIAPGSAVVLNGDDALLLKTARRFKRQCLTFGLGETCDIRATDILDQGREGLRFHLRYGGEMGAINLGLPGLQNVANALAAAAIGFCLHASFAHVRAGLAGFRGVKGRFMMIPLSDRVLLIDDTYNANPSSLRVALDAVQKMRREGDQVIIGLGDMMELGESAVEAHEGAGRRVAKGGFDYLVAMGEHAGVMVKGAVRAGMPEDRARAVPSHEAMTAVIKDWMTPDSLILLKASRRMALERVVEGLEAGVA